MRAAAIAASQPACPAPTTTTSYFSVKPETMTGNPALEARTYFSKAQASLHLRAVPRGAERRSALGGTPLAPTKAERRSALRPRNPETQTRRNECVAGQIRYAR